MNIAGRGDVGGCFYAAPRRGLLSDAEERLDPDLRRGDVQGMDAVVIYSVIPAQAGIQTRGWVWRDRSVGAEAFPVQTEIMRDG